jgi:phosphate transport system substrate-binding protein
MLKNISLAITALVCLSAVTATAETVKVAGSGGMIPLLNGLAKEYAKKNPKDTIDVQQNSLGKEGGLMALTKNAIDIAMLSTVTDKDKALPITTVPIAIVPSIFAVIPA